MKILLLPTTLDVFGCLAILNFDAFRNVSSLKILYYNHHLAVKGLATCGLIQASIIQVSVNVFLSFLSVNIKEKIICILTISSLRVFEIWMQAVDCSCCIILPPTSKLLFHHLRNVYSSHMKH
jgi:hypothetical protein